MYKRQYDEFYPVLEKAWVALNGCLHEDGKLGFVQVPGAAPEKVTFEDNEVYGVCLLYTSRCV